MMVMMMIKAINYKLNQETEKNQHEIFSSGRVAYSPKNTIIIEGHGAGIDQIAAGK
jgi:hypothetical protein